MALDVIELTKELVKIESVSRNSNFAVADKLGAREGTSGIAEKASRRQ